MIWRAWESHRSQSLGREVTGGSVVVEALWAVLPFSEVVPVVQQEAVTAVVVSSALLHLQHWLLVLALEEALATTSPPRHLSRLE